MDRWSQDLNTAFSLKTCLFGAVKLTKNADPDKYFYLGYRIGFQSRLLFLFPGFNWVKNVVIFGVDNSYFVHIDNNRKDILGKGLIQELDDILITAEVKYCINFSRSERTFYFKSSL